MKTVFLGGTCNNSTWRERLKPLLTIDYFDPVVKDWNEEAVKRELEWREKADIVLYVITPEMKGVYSIAEVVDDSNKRPWKTVFCVLDLEKFDIHASKSLIQTGRLVSKNGAKSCYSLEEVAEILNNF